MSIYNRLEQTASRLLKRYGFAADFIRRTNTADYDPALGGYQQREARFTRNIVRQNFTITERADSSIEQGDIKLIAESGDYKIGDKVVIDSQEYRLFMADPITPATINCAYVLGARR